MNTITITQGKQSTVITKDINGKDQSIDKNTQVITYTYDPIGNLTQTDADGLVINLSYDALGNKTQMIDPSMGTWTYTYNGFGDLISQTDAKTQTTNITYNKLNRVTQKSLAGEVSNWVYDNQARLTSESKTKVGKLISSKTYTYDNLSRLKSTTLSIIDNNQTQDYTSSYEYNKQSRIKTIIHPDGFKEERTYAISGVVKQLSVPKSSVWDYDYLALEDAMAKTAVRILELQHQAQQFEQKSQEYIMLSNKYQHYADTYQASSDKYTKEAQILQNSANNLYRQASINQQRANEYRAKANYYWAKFGNTTLHYVRAVNGQHYYRNTDCTSTNWKGRGAVAFHQHALLTPHAFITNGQIFIKTKPMMIALKPITNKLRHKQPKPKPTKCLKTPKSMPNLPNSKPICLVKL